MSPTPDPLPRFEAATSYFGFVRVGPTSHALYLLLLGLVLLGGLLLPFIRVQVSRQAGGLLRPRAAKTELRPLVAGTITRLHLRENQRVRQGDTLVVLQSGSLTAQRLLNTRQQREKQQLLADLQALLTQLAPPASGLQTALYGQQAAQFQQQQRLLQGQVEKSQRELARTRRLYQGRVIARVELEEKQYAARKLAEELQVLRESQRTQWQSQRNTLQTELAQLRAEASQLTQQQQLHAVVAPVSGTLQEVAGKYSGSPLQAGELLATISPDGDLVAECLVEPRDIGFIRVGLPARCQVEAFNYNQWGMLEGRVSSVSHDLVLVAGKPAFRVLCRLNRSYLQLPTGQRGQLSKGMSVRVRFLLARRSLWQLLFDQADDWLNPTQAAQVPT